VSVVHLIVLISVQIIKEMSGSVASGTPCIMHHNRFLVKNIQLLWSGSFSTR